MTSVLREEDGSGGHTAVDDGTQRARAAHGHPPRGSSRRFHSSRPQCALVPGLRKCGRSPCFPEPGLGLRDGRSAASDPQKSHFGKARASQEQGQHGGALGNHPGALQQQKRRRVAHDNWPGGTNTGRASQQATSESMTVRAPPARAERHLCVEPLPPARPRDAAAVPSQ